MSWGRGGHVADPYQMGLLKSNPFVCKCQVGGKLVAVLQGRLEKRGLSLIMPISRVLCRGEIHELIMTGEDTAGPGQLVNKIAYLGFFEVHRGGIILLGDRILIGNKDVGVVAGYDETHLPNHLNIVIRGLPCLSGSELGLQVGERVILR